MLAERFDAILDHDTVLAKQRHNVRNRAERHVIEHLLKPGLKSAEIVFPAILDKGVRELERSSGSGKDLQVSKFGIDLRIDYRKSFRQFTAGLVVVGHDHVDAAGDRDVDGIAAGNPAINRHKNAALPERIERLLQRFRGKSVAVIEAMRNKRMYDSAVLPEDQREQSTGGDAVGIVIAVNQDRLPGGDRLPETFCSGLDAGEPVGIAEIRETGIQKILNLIFLDAARRKKKCDRPRQRKSMLDRFDLVFKIIPGKLPIFYTHVTLSILKLITYTITPKPSNSKSRRELFLKILMNLVYDKLSRADSERGDGFPSPFSYARSFFEISDFSI